MRTSLLVEVFAIKQCAVFKEYAQLLLDVQRLIFPSIPVRPGMETSLRNLQTAHDADW